jgi:hypothetical protein
MRLPDIFSPSHRGGASWANQTPNKLKNMSNKLVSAKNGEQPVIVYDRKLRDAAGFLCSAGGVLLALATKITNGESAEQLMSFILEKAEAMEPAVQTVAKYIPWHLLLESAKEVPKEEVIFFSWLPTSNDDFASFGARHGDALYIHPLVCDLLEHEVDLFACDEHPSYVRNHDGVLFFPADWLLRKVNEELFAPAVEMIRARGLQFRISN